MGGRSFWLAAALAAAAAQGEAAEFAVRADPKRFDVLQPVIDAFAARQEVELPAGIAPQRFFELNCGGRVPEHRVVADGATTKLEFKPCLKSRKPTDVKVEPGDTFERLAQRKGLHPSAARDLRVIRANPDIRTVRSATTLQPGDLVRLPPTPTWTRFRSLDPAATRAQLVARLAEALNCGSEEAEACLLRLNVYLFTDQSAAHRAVAPRGADRSLSRQWQFNAAPVVGPSAPSPIPPRVAVPALPGLGSITSGGVSATTGSSRPPASTAAAPTTDAVAAAAAAAATAAAALETSAGTAAGAGSGRLSVASEQWPYDAGLVVRTLARAAERAPVRPALVGVAENGLGGRDGAPLPADALAQFEQAIDNADSDGSDYIDDVVGAGTRRSESVAMPDGDVSICPSQQPNYAGWRADVREQVSHGSVVASIAAGLQLRSKDPAVGKLLPRVTFFRMLRGACDEAGPFVFDPVVADEAVEYLTNRTEIVNLSYVASGQNGKVLAKLLKIQLDGSDRLLFVPAGNDISDDIDKLPLLCPPCLGNSDNLINAARRIVVVGAATQALQRTSFTGYGARTVRLYAPSEPIGALDIAGNPFPADRAATSYAAPLAALAASLLLSLGVDDIDHVRERLSLASWPLHDAAGDPDPSGARVVDLVKVAAVRHHAVEYRTDDDELRTAVGDIEGELALGTCEIPPSIEAHQAIRLGPANAEGDRELTFFFQKLDQATRRLKSRSCISETPGQLRLRQVDGSTLDVELSKVTSILLPWRLVG